MNISRNSNDVILKYMSGTFKDTTLDFYGLNVPKIKRVVPAELPILEVSDELMDFVFELEDDSYLHLEFQTTVRSDDLSRFALYDLRLYKKDGRRIHTVVIYSGDIERATELLDIGSINYRVQNIYMQRYDGDNIYNVLKHKIEQNEKLSKMDLINLVFLPLMKTLQDKNKRAIDAVELAIKIQDNEQKVFCTGAIIGIAYKFVDENVIDWLKEVCKMNNWLLEELTKDAVTKALKKGEEEGEKNKALNVAKKLLSKGADIETIIEVTELTKEEVESLVTC